MTGTPRLRVVGRTEPDDADGAATGGQLEDAVLIRPALPADVPEIDALVHEYAAQRILLPKELVGYYEAIQEFIVAQDAVSGRVIGCGALHVMWRDLAEVRTLAVDPERKGHGVGRRLVHTLLDRARALTVTRVFCLTFEVEFFTRLGFHEITGTPVNRDVYQELLRSPDDGVAEFLDLVRVKPNTLGNSRMLIEF